MWVTAMCDVRLGDAKRLFWDWFRSWWLVEVEKKKQSTKEGFYLFIYLFMSLFICLFIYILHSRSMGDIYTRYTVGGYLSFVLLQLCFL